LGRTPKPSKPERAQSTPASAVLPLKKKVKRKVKVEEEAEDILVP